MEHGLVLLMEESCASGMLCEVLDFPVVCNTVPRLRRMVDCRFERFFA